jgi:hypothetical protein
VLAELISIAHVSIVTAGLRSPAVFYPARGRGFGASRQRDVQSDLPAIDDSGWDDGGRLAAEQPRNPGNRDLALGKYQLGRRSFPIAIARR